MEEKPNQSNNQSIQSAFQRQNRNKRSRKKNQCIFFPHRNTSNMSTIDLRSKKKREIETDLTFPHLAMGILHIENYIICAGGWREKHLRDVARITNNGDLAELTPMPIGKAKFPLIHWKSGKSVLTVGGYSDFNLKEVTSFDMIAQKWRYLPSLQTAFASRAGCVVEPNVLYCFGGWRRQIGRSIESLSLNRLELIWKKLNIGGGTIFVARNRDSAISVRNSIIVFGSWNGKATVELDATKKEDNLQVVRKQHNCINYSTSSYATYKLYRTELYAFERDRTEEVFKYGEEGWVETI